MTNWLVSREAVKGSAQLRGADLHALIDSIIEAKSREIERHTRRIFIPKTETRLYRWPQRDAIRSVQLELDADLQSVTTLQSKAQNATPTTIAATDYFLEPNNEGPPYDVIEIDLSSTAAFEAGDTPQRSISVLGSWGYSADTRSTGTVSSGLDADATVTSMVCSDAGLIDVGDTLLIESEQIFVSDRDFAARGSILLNMAGNLAADMATVTVAVDGSHGIVANEVIRINSERMFVVSVSTNDLTVIRAYDGSVLAAHTDNDAIHINRTLTIERGVNGTTAATHADTTAISKYEPPFDIRELVKAEVISHLEQDRGAWARMTGAGDNAREATGVGLKDLRERVEPYMRRMRSGVI